jgi:DNA-directed RNA polymerase sigma subunit (sigma70/sigma32)
MPCTTADRVLAVRQRRENMLKMKELGFSYRLLGLIYNLSHERVRQLVSEALAYRRFMS